MNPAAIEQVDAVLAEDGLHVVFLGHTTDEDVNFAAGLSLPSPIDEAAFLCSDWRKVTGLKWRRV